MQSRGTRRVEATIVQWAKPGGVTPNGIEARATLTFPGGLPLAFMRMCICMRTRVRVYVYVYAYVYVYVYYMYM